MVFFVGEKWFEFSWFELNNPVLYQQVNYFLSFWKEGRIIGFKKIRKPVLVIKQAFLIIFLSQTHLP